MNKLADTLVIISVSTALMMGVQSAEARGGEIGGSRITTSFGSASEADNDDSSATSITAECPEEISQELTLGETNDTGLIEAYIEQCFNEQLSKHESPELFALESRGLTGREAALYNLVSPLICEVAAGERSSSVFEISPSSVYETCSWTAEDLRINAIVVDGAISEEALDAVSERLDIDITLVLDRLLADMPYELYWYDKSCSTSLDTSQLGLTAKHDGGEWVISVTGTIALTMPVSADYSLNGETGTYEVDTTTGQRVSTAVETATGVAVEGAELSTRDRLAHFKDRICGLVSYNYDAASDEDRPYGDPWQLIYVFDGDDDTNVVCEGYAKAFKYLCDLAAIEGTHCVTATGVMSGGTGAGAHMWNIVNMDDGFNYLVDVTNCDEGAVGYSDLLFMVPYSTGSVTDGYAFDVGDEHIFYSYDDDMRLVYDEDELAIASTPYTGAEQLEPTAGWNRFGTTEWQIQGDTLTFRPLKNGESGTLPSVRGPLPSAADACVRHVVFSPGVKAGESLACAFFECKNIESIDFGNLDTSDTVYMHNMFEGCESLVSLDLSGWDTSHVTVTSGMFSGCNSLSQFVCGEGATSTLLEQLPSYSINGHADWWSQGDSRWYNVNEIASARAGVADTYLKVGPSELSASAATGPIGKGDVAHFRCEVEGADSADISYQWQYTTDGETWKNLGWVTAKSETLEAEATEYRIRTQTYRCVVTASDGREAMTDAIGFEIAVPLTELVATATTETVALGEVGAFTCAVEGAGDTGLAYQWQYTTDGGETWRNLGWATAKSDTLAAEATEYRARAQRYRCVVTASDGREAITDAIGFEIAELQVKLAATAATEPVALGEVGAFACSVEGAGDAGLSFQWQYTADGGETWRNLGWATAKSDTLTAEATEYRARAQKYRCVVTASDGREAMTDAIGFEIAVPLTELVATATTETVALGEVGAFTCAVEGAGDTGLAYQWQYTTDGGETWRNLGWATAKSDTLAAEATEYRARAQRYRCVVTASDGRTAESNAVAFEVGVEIESFVYSDVSPDLLVHTGPDLVGIGVQGVA